MTPVCNWLLLVGLGGLSLRELGVAHTGWREAGTASCRLNTGAPVKQEGALCLLLHVNPAPSSSDLRKVKNSSQGPNLLPPVSPHLYTGDE